MFEVGLLAFMSVVLLGAWLMLQIEIAEAILILIFLGTALLAIYWTWVGGWDSEVARRTGIFAVVLVTMGVVRLAAEKVSDALHKPRQ